MSSQMFWLLSYLSLGLALSLGSRPTSVHSSSSQQQQQQEEKQQSTSSSQGQKLRQENRFGDRTIVNNDLRSMETVPVIELDNLRSYRYVGSSGDDDSTRDWLSRVDRQSWRHETNFLQSRNLDDDDNTNDDELNDNGRSELRDNRFLNEFATAVLDTLYPRNRDLLVAAKPPNIRKNNVNTGFNDNWLDGIERDTRLTKKTRTATIGQQREYGKKMSKSPIVIYREEPVNAPLAINVGKIFNKGGKFELTAPNPGNLEQASLRNSNDWMTNEENYAGHARRDNELTKRRDNEIDNPWIIDDRIVDTSNSDGISESERMLGKRNQGGRGRTANTRGGWSPNGQQSQQTPSVTSPGASIASQFLLRSARGNRQYDVPQIECPASEDGMERFACPTPDRMGRYRCIDDHVLCDGFIDCPTAEDEDRQACMFYKTTKAHLDVLADALLRWARGR